VKYHPVETDDKKLKRIAQKNKLSQSWIVGRYATPGFENFLWGGSILLLQSGKVKDKNLSPVLPVRGSFLNIDLMRW
jgi:hypothetical protein